MNFNNLKLSFEETLAVITLDRPPVNALNEETLDELGEALKRIVSDSKLRVVLIASASPKAFIAGADIGRFAAMDLQEAARLIKKGQDLFHAMETFSLPIIAAINGPCLGGGCELALACHLRIASEKARFGQPEINLGIMPGWGGTQRLPRIVGRTRALELLLTGEIIDAGEAYNLGLINSIVPAEDLVREGRMLADKLSRQAPMALKAIIETVSLGAALPMKEGEALEAAAFKTVFASRDAREGIGAFLEKRKPRFNNN